MDRIMKLEPAYKDYVWGGEKLVKEYNKNSPYEKTAESWELSCHKNGMTRISGGEYDGATLFDVISEAKRSGIDLLGKNCERFSDFPILIKLIDANASLSIQVHPDNEYANEHECGGFGKTEVWYVVSADEGAELVYGFSRDVTREEIRGAIECNELAPLLKSVPVKAGDVFFVPAGLLHAIGKDAPRREVRGVRRACDADRQDRPLRSQLEGVLKEESAARGGIEAADAARTR
jgi:mannose-6-phosphate isomerase